MIPPIIGFLGFLGIFHILTVHRLWSEKRPSKPLLKIDGQRTIGSSPSSADSEHTALAYNALKADYWENQFTVTIGVVLTLTSVSKVSMTAGMWNVGNCYQKLRKNNSSMQIADSGLRKWHTSLRVSSAFQAASLSATSRSLSSK